MFWTAFFCLLFGLLVVVVVLFLFLFCFVLLFVCLFFVCFCFFVFFGFVLFSSSFSFLTHNFFCVLIFRFNNQRAGTSLVLLLSTFDKNYHQLAYTPFNHIGPITPPVKFIELCYFSPRSGCGKVTDCQETLPSGLFYMVTKFSLIWVYIVGFIA